MQKLLIIGEYVGVVLRLVMQLLLELQTDCFYVRDEGFACVDVYFFEDYELFELAEGFGVVFHDEPAYFLCGCGDVVGGLWAVGGQC